MMDPDLVRIFELIGYRSGLNLVVALSDSVAALAGSDAARVAADPSGSRVVEALLEGSAPAKVWEGLGGLC